MIPATIKKQRITTEDATVQHAHNLAPRLGALDLQEIGIYSKATPLDALLTGVDVSVDASALVRDGQVLAIWGVIETENYHGDYLGAPWLLAASPAEFDLAATRQLLIGTRASIDRWHKMFNTLFGFSWAGATDHHRLLRKLGFQLSEETTVAIDTMEDIPPTVYFARQESNVRTGAKFFN
jgi:hypothetical protein